MKKFIQVNILLIVFYFLTSGSVIAQKYGYLNSANLLEQMPDRIQADAELEAFQAPLIAEGKAKREALKRKEEALFKKIENGALLRLEIEKQQTALQKAQDEIPNFEQSVQDKILTKRQELLVPILNKVEAAIEMVAKEHGFALTLAYLMSYYMLRKLKI